MVTVRNVFIFSLAAISLAGCGIFDKPAPQPAPIISAEPAIPPAGVVAYCWEEPLVIFQDNGPGVDPDGNWYHPSYKAVREVRSGRWRPCSPVAPESVGAGQQ